MPRSLKLSALRVMRFLTQLFFFITINIYLFQDYLGVLGALFLNFIDLFVVFFPVLPIAQSVAGPFTRIPGAFDLIQVKLTSGEFPFLEIGIILLLGAIFGRAFCGWVCPFGFIQDLLSYIPVKKINLSKSTNWVVIKLRDFLLRIKYYILYTTLFFCSWIFILTLTGTEEALVEALGVFSEAPWAVISPVITLETFLPNLVMNHDLEEIASLLYSLDLFFWMRISFLVVIFVVSAYVPRAYCRWICPMGALMSYFNKYSIIRVKKNPLKCKNCRLCERCCPTEVKISKEKREISSGECILCLRCISVCEEGGLEIGV
ncbi:MAG: 4Fe-4S binding protein [Candidatus Asgardarchaeia archaeon]